MARALLRRGYWGFEWPSLRPMRRRTCILNRRRTVLRQPAVNVPARITMTPAPNLRRGHPRYFHFKQPDWGSGYPSAMPREKLDRLFTAERDVEECCCPHWRLPQKPAAAAVPELTRNADINLNTRVSLQPIQTSLAWLQVAEMANSPRLSTARSGAASPNPKRRPRPIKPKEPAGLSRQAPYAVTPAGPWGRSAIAYESIRRKLRNAWHLPPTLQSRKKSDSTPPDHIPAAPGVRKMICHG